VCGIAVALDRRASVEELTDCVRSMLVRVAHRGDPDKLCSIAAGPDVVLGCNRLAIVDRDHAVQPLTTPSGSFAVVYNGEIYNHRALRRELVDAGHRFATEGDTEVLLHGYEAWGEGLPERLDGVFAFVLVDLRRARVFAARDPFGVKPLYYSVCGERLLVASELKALAGGEAQPRELAPGHCLSGNVQRPWFELRRRPVPDDDEALVAEYRRLLEEAVAKRVDTDLPVGVIFSGGLDSAAVLRLAVERHPCVTAYTAGFEDAEDLAVARRYCAELGVEHVVTVLDLDLLVERLPRVIVQSELFETVDVMDASVSSLAFEAAARRGLKVVLTGDGSDELLAGYDLFRRHPDPQALLDYRLGNLYRTDLQRVDRMSMAYGVEARVPFLDRRLVELAYSAPLRLKLRDGVEKWLLRAAVDDLLPEYVAWRPKSRMAEGSGLFDRLVEWARQQRTALPCEVLERLSIRHPDGAYLLEQYLAAGYPLPHERHKRVGFDYFENGFFHFPTQRVEEALAAS
jgi:asparagine synthase (glutamine-hydrolysing)